MPTPPSHAFLNMVTPTRSSSHGGGQGRSKVIELEGGGPTVLPTSFNGDVDGMKGERMVAISSLRLSNVSKGIGEGIMPIFGYQVS